MRGCEGVEFITLDKSAGLAGIAEVRRRLTGRRFDVLLHMHASMRANLISLAVRADRRVGFDRDRARDFQWLFTREQIPAHPRQHVMDGLFEFAEYLGVSQRLLRWDIPLSRDNRAFAAEHCQHHGPVVVISPCSSQRFRNFRNWSVENYVAVISQLQSRYGAKIILTGGPTSLEAEYGANIEAQSSSPLINLIGKTTLKQLFAVLKSASLVICPDSGPAHLANAAGTPVVGLYATSNRWRTGPYNWQELVVDRYPEAVLREFGKAPESLDWGVRVRDPQAMDLITPNDVLQKIAQVIPGSSHSPGTQKNGI